jgi:NAD(P)-dependent dehydrogenase (short-subunit alcohol dehydrogenase family)
MSDTTLPPKQLKGQTALVTSAGQDAGRLFARVLAVAGADLALQDEDEAALNETIASAEALGVEARPLTDPAAPALVFDHLDLTVQVVEMDENGWQWMLQDSRPGWLELLKTAVGQMRQQGHGTAILTIYPPVDPGPAFQEGLKVLAQFAAAEYRQYGIPVQILLLSDALHATLRSGLKELTDAQKKQATGLAELLLYLCSPQAATMSGQVLKIDQGESI